MVDATDRLRIEDCREELHGLLLEEVMIADEQWFTRIELLMTRAAFIWGQFAHLCEQDRRRGVHGRAGNSKGEKKKKNDGLGEMQAVCG